MSKYSRSRRAATPDEDAMRIDARTSDARDLRIRGAHRDMGGNIISGKDALTGAEVKAPPMPMGTPVSPEFNSAFSRPLTTWADRQAANQSGVIAARNRMDPGVQAQAGQILPRADKLQAATQAAGAAASAILPMGGVGIQMAGQQRADQMRADVPGQAVEAADSAAAADVASRTAAAGAQIKSRSMMDQASRLGPHPGTIQQVPYGIIQPTKYASPGTPLARGPRIMDEKGDQTPARRSTTPLLTGSRIADETGDRTAEFAQPTGRRLIASTQPTPPPAPGAAPVPFRTGESNVIAAQPPAPPAFRTGESSIQPRVTPAFRTGESTVPPAPKTVADEDMVKELLSQGGPITPRAGQPASLFPDGMADYTRRRKRTF